MIVERVIRSTIEYGALTIPAASWAPLNLSHVDYSRPGEAKPRPVVLPAPSCPRGRARGWVHRRAAIGRRATGR